jgi:hypothetical protein
MYAVDLQLRSPVRLSLIVCFSSLPRFSIYPVSSLLISSPLMDTICTPRSAPYPANLLCSDNTVVSPVRPYFAPHRTILGTVRVGPPFSPVVQYRGCAVVPLHVILVYRVATVYRPYRRLAEKKLLMNTRLVQVFSFLSSPPVELRSCPALPGIMLHAVK